MTSFIVVLPISIADNMPSNQANSQEAELQKQIITLEENGKDKDSVIAFNSKLYKIGDLLECLKQALVADQGTALNQILISKGMPAFERYLGNLTYQSGVACQVLGLDGATWTAGSIRLKLVLELIAEKEVVPSQEIAEELNESPADEKDPALNELRLSLTESNGQI
nr:KGK domain-containing protein [Pseudanabaena sp. FACHB-2040]